MENDNVYHVIPMNDLKDHLTESYFPSITRPDHGPSDVPQPYCTCKPKVMRHGDGWVVIHTSWDGREGVEWAKAILDVSPDQSSPDAKDLQ